MRIVCKKCAAAYAIDDRLITPAGVRAQCPRCRHLEFVKPENASRRALSLELDLSAPPSVGPPTGEVPVASDEDVVEAPVRTDESPAGAPQCARCGKALEDAFERALGECDGCRVPSGVSASPVVSPSRPVPREFTRPVVEEGEEEAPRARPPRSWRLGVLAVVGLVVGGVAATLLVKRPWVRKAPPLAQRAPTNPKSDVLDRWRAVFGSVEGTVGEHVTQGEAALLLDTATGYLEAETGFQRALLLDARNVRAVSGYALALGFGRGTQLDDQRYADALSLVVQAEGRFGDVPRLLVAHAVLLLTRPSPSSSSDARVLAERALAVSKDTKDRALAHLVVALSHRKASEVWAAQALERALEADGELKRAHHLRAIVLLDAGDYLAAIEALEKRSQLDPDHWDATWVLARIYAEISDFANARRVLDRAQTASATRVRAQLTRAVLAYQHEGRLDEAVQSLEALLEDRDRHDPAEVTTMLLHLGTARRLAGQGDKAQRDLTDLLALDPNDAQARLQLILLALEKGDAVGARAEFRALEGKLGDASLQKLLEGRILLVEGQPSLAADALEAAARQGGRLVEATLLAGAAAARAKQETRAWKLVLQQGLKLDPWKARSREALARTYVRTSDLLRGTAGAFLALAKGREDPNPHLAEGLVAYHSGDHASADRHFQRVIAIDPSNGSALAFRALIALERGDRKSALKLATAGVAADRTVALAHHAKARALMAAGVEDEARRELVAAQTGDPHLLAVRVALGELELRAGRTDEGRKILNAVLAVDRNYPGVKKALCRKGNTP